jgi:hypothetical protein
MNKFFAAKQINTAAAATTEGKTPTIIKIAANSDGIKSHIMVTLKGHTSAELGSTKKAAVDTIISLHEAITTATDAKRNLRRSIGNTVNMGIVPVSQRLLAVRTAAALKAFRQCNYNLGRNTLDDEVAFSDDPATWGGYTAEDVDYTTYRGRFKGWACTNRYAALTLPADWRTRVQNRGLEKVSGLFTIDAVLLDSNTQDVEVFSAKWLEQGRGTALGTTTGFIALTHAEGGKTYGYHSEVSADNAVQGVVRKASLGGISSLPVGAAFIDFIGGYIGKHGDFVMVVGVAR